MISTPLIIAHRGASASAPENTIAAFRAAIEQGADGVELDVQLTSDAVAVVFHDRTLRRTTGHRERLATIDGARLRSFDCGTWFGSAFSSERIPTLVEVLDDMRGRY